MNKRLVTFFFCLILLCSLPVRAESNAKASDDAAVSGSSAAAEAPSADELTKGYFDVLAKLEPGTAGVSLKTAAAASKVFAFAEKYELYNPDKEGLSANLAKAFGKMDKESEAAFWQGFDMVQVLMDKCVEDYEKNRPVFEDAGVADEMDKIMAEPRNSLAWENLRDCTSALRQS